MQNQETHIDRNGRKRENVTFSMTHEIKLLLDFKARGYLGE